MEVWEEDPARQVWHVEDREIGVIVEANVQTYRAIDLEDFGRAIAEGRLATDDAQRLLMATKAVLDRHLHNGGRFRPPAMAGRQDGPVRPETVEGGGR